MAKSKTVLIDELHVAVRVPDDLSQDERDEVRRALAADEFLARLRRAIRAAFRAFPELAVVHLSLNR